MLHLDRASIRRTRNSKYPRTAGSRQSIAFHYYLLGWSARAGIFFAVGLTVLVTGKYRNEFPFNFSLILHSGSSCAIPNQWNGLRICLLQLDGSREQTFKRIETREASDERLFTIPEHVRRGYISNTPANETLRRVALLEGIGRGKRATICWSYWYLTQHRRSKRTRETHLVYRTFDKIPEGYARLFDSEACPHRSF